MTQTAIIEVDVLRELEKTFFDKLNDIEDKKIISKVTQIYLESQIEVLNNRVKPE